MHYKLIKRYFSNICGIYLHPSYAEIIYYLILKIVFIHTQEFVWMVLLHIYSIKSSLRFLTCSSLHFRPYIYWIHLWMEFHLGNRFNLYHIMSNIIYVSFCFCDCLFSWAMHQYIKWKLFPRTTGERGCARGS